MKLQTAEIPMRFWHFLDLTFKEVMGLQEVNLVPIMLEAEIFCVFFVSSFSLMSLGNLSQVMKIESKGSFRISIKSLVK